MTERNTPPADAFDVLRRLYNCNWNQLAARLGVTPQTLREWRKDSPGKNGCMRMADLCQTALRTAEADWMPLSIDYGRIATIHGKR